MQMQMSLWEHRRLHLEMAGESAVATEWPFELSES